MSDHVNRYIREITSLDLSVIRFPGGIAICKYDAEFTILEADQPYLDLVGFSRQQMWQQFENKGIRLIHPDDVKVTMPDFKRQIEQSEDQSFWLQSRYLHADGQYHLTNFSGRLFYREDTGEPLVSFVVCDASEKDAAEHELRKERSFNQLISELTEDTFFDYDVRTLTIRYSKNFADWMGLDEVIYNYPESIIQMGLVAPESFDFFYKEIENKPEGALGDEVHLISRTGENRWYNVFYRNITDHMGEVVRVVGKMNDITKQHIRIDELTQKSQRDQLTSLYNKMTTEYLIREALKMRREYDEKFALMIIDLDNFKDINDRLGHLYGDIVLTKLGKKLKAVFRSEDIVGRIGGDEFFVFLTHYGSRDVLKAKAREVCRLFEHVYNENGAVVNISASIGIACCPEHGDNYDTLYKNADAALYTAKERGKNMFVVYDDGINPNYCPARTEIDVQNVAHKGFDDNRAEYIFRMMYSASDAEESVRRALRMTAEQFEFGRAYIFEFDEANHTFSSTFDWCAPQCNPIERELPAELCEKIAESIRETGICVFRGEEETGQWTLMREQGVCSSVMFALKDAEKLCGFIGFDDCACARDFSVKELDEISTICHILGTFYTKHRSAEAEQKSNQMLSAIMENIEGFVYVVDQQNYRVLYENKQLKLLTKRACAGRVCYEAYMHRDQPCEICPLTELKQSGKQKHSVQIYNEEYGLTTVTMGSRIDWTNDEHAYLINSIDLTAFGRGAASDED